MWRSASPSARGRLHRRGEMRRPFLTARWESLVRDDPTRRWPACPPASDAEHLAQGLLAVAEEHQAELAHDRIEAVCRVRERRSRAVLPSIAGANCSSTASMPWSASSHDTGGPDAGCRFACEHARAAGDVHDTMPGLCASGVTEDRSRLPERRRHMQLFVGVRRSDLLSKNVVIHGPSPGCGPDGTATSEPAPRAQRPRRNRSSTRACIQ